MGKIRWFLWLHAKDSQPFSGMASQRTKVRELSASRKRTKVCELFSHSLMEVGDALGLEETLGLALGEEDGEAVGLCEGYAEGNALGEPLGESVIRRPQPDKNWHSLPHVS